MLYGRRSSLLIDGQHVTILKSIRHEKNDIYGDHMCL